MSTDRTERFLKRPEVEARTGFSTSHLYDLMSRGEFPRSVKLSARAVGWPESAVQKWIEDRIAAAAATAA